MGGFGIGQPNAEDAKVSQKAQKGIKKMIDCFCDFCDFCVAFVFLLRSAARIGLT